MCVGGGGCVGERKSERVYLFIYSMLCILYIRNFIYLFTVSVCLYVCIRMYNFLFCFSVFVSM